MKEISKKKILSSVFIWELENFCLQQKKSFFAFNYL